LIHFYKRQKCLFNKNGKMAESFDRHTGFKYFLCRLFLDLRQNHGLLQN